MARAWFDKREYGAAWGIRAGRSLALMVGRRAARFLLWPVTAYFFVVARDGRQGLAAYHAHITPGGAGLAQLFHHHLTFARTILDRTYLLARHKDAPPYEIHGFENVEQALQSGTGAVLLGAHLGSFEAARAAGFLRPDLKIQVIMHPGISRKLNSILAALHPGAEQSVVTLGGPAALLQVKETLAEGGLVGVMGDRVRAGEETYEASFLGETASFPLGPLRLAAALGAPVFFFTALYRRAVDGSCYYELVFKPLSGPAPPGPLRAAWMRDLGARYVSALEAYCRIAPDNWFNFYDFWQSEVGRGGRRRTSVDGSREQGRGAPTAVGGAGTATHPEPRRKP